MGRRRKHSTIDMLDPAVKSTVDEMIMSAQFTYKDICEYISDTAGQSISQAAVCRYAKGLCEDVAAIHMAQENIKSIAAECAKYPDLDATEGIVKVMTSIMMSAIRELSPDDLQTADPIKLIKQASELVKAVSYKRNLDIKSKEISEAGFDAVKSKIFAAMAKDNPKLYAELTEYINGRIAESKGDSI